MSLEASGLGHLDLLRDVLEPLNELSIEVVDLDLGSKWVCVVDISQPKSPVRILVIYQPCGHRLANPVVLIFVHSQVVALLVDRVDQVETRVLV